VTTAAPGACRSSGARCSARQIRLSPSICEGSVFTLPLSSLGEKKCRHRHAPTAADAGLRPVSSIWRRSRRLSAMTSGERDSGASRVSSAECVESSFDEFWCVRQIVDTPRSLCLRVRQPYVVRRLRWRKREIISARTPRDVLSGTEHPLPPCSSRSRSCDGPAEPRYGAQ